jgi:molybdate transport system ATP-binding protein
MSVEFDLKLPRRDFDLELKGSFNKGITGIFGPSGAGKTTFFNLLSGLEMPEKGFVSLEGRVLTDTDKKIFIPVHKRRIGVVFQDKLLFPHLSVKDNLLFGVPFSMGKKVSFDDVVDLLNLSSILKSKPHDISGGEQQRTAIGRALLTSPELFLFDEPFNAVDYSLRSAILPYIRSLNEILDIPILVISHDLSDLQCLTNQVFSISRGKEQGHGDLFAYLESSAVVSSIKIG